MINFLSADFPLLLNHFPSQSLLWNLVRLACGSRSARAVAEPDSCLTKVVLSLCLLRIRNPCLSGMKDPSYTLQSSIPLPDLLTKFQMKKLHPRQSPSQTVKTGAVIIPSPPHPPGAVALGRVPGMSPAGFHLTGLLQVHPLYTRH